MDFGSLEEEVNAIKSAAMALSSQGHLNKAQVWHQISNAHAYPGLPALLRMPTVPYVIPKMPDDAFCYVVSVSDCTFNEKIHGCECSKTMMFGKSAKVCTRIVKESTPVQCQNDWHVLKEGCAVDVIMPCNQAWLPPRSCEQLAKEFDCYRNKAKLLESTLAEVLGYLMEKAPDEMIKIIGSNYSTSVCEAPQ